MKNGSTKVFVAMSGGVDSSVAAALLKEAGYEVTGVFIKGWYPPWLPCNWRDERADAMRVAVRLGIPFETFDFGEAYRRDVAEHMIVEYGAGRTPNPDVLCNKHIKFGAFFTEAIRRGADMIATGHYARISSADEMREARNPKSEILNKSQVLNSKSQTTTYQLLTGVDTEKDQSYFLWTLSQEVLGRTLFPIGEYTKSEVRELARKFTLPTAEKKDSQGVCFLGDIDMRDFLKHEMKTESGSVLDERGETIGTHEGAPLYTLGQRHGFTVRARRPDERRHYVVAKDMERNTITVSERPRAPAFAVSEVVLKDAHWIADVPRAGVLYGARFRYRQKLQSCKLEKHEARSRKHETWRVMFEESQTAVAPGQSLVLYDRNPLDGCGGERCLGGGVIV
jgi:tRNA-specific 2-thiouridylase